MLVEFIKINRPCKYICGLKEVNLTSSGRIRSAATSSLMQLTKSVETSFSEWRFPIA
jgi:hypothetical protein